MRDRTLLLIVAALALGGVVHLERADGLFAGPPAATLAVEPTPEPFDSPDAPEKVALDAAAAIDAIVERPLFHPGRRAGVAEAGPAAEGPDPARLEAARVVGVARVGAAWFALLRPADGGEPVSLAVGDAHEGWRVVAIGAEGVTFADAPGAAARRVTLAPRVARP